VIAALVVIALASRSDTPTPAAGRQTTTTLATAAHSGTHRTTTTTRAPTTSTRPKRTTTTTTPADGLAVIKESALNTQAADTLVAIRAGGPFDFPRNDGVVYHNLNRVLPRQRDGYYREYTVRTPGASNRGARRLVTGAGGELYYTSDHYQTFWRVLEHQ
jgi:guanyl-specific ribonuclease Sa